MGQRNLIVTRLEVYRVGFYVSNYKDSPNRNETIAQFYLVPSDFLNLCGFMVENISTSYQLEKNRNDMDFLNLSSHQPRTTCHISISNDIWHGNEISQDSVLIYQSSIEQIQIQLKMIEINFTNKCILYRNQLFKKYNFNNFGVARTYLFFNHLEKFQRIYLMS